MQHRISLSTNLLIVLAANKRRKMQMQQQPKVKGIKVDFTKVKSAPCRKLQVDCHGKIEKVEALLAMA